MILAPLRRQLVILHVEDSPWDRALVQQALEKGEYSSTLHVVENGIEATKFLRRGQGHADAPRPNLILLDLSLPGLNGEDVLRIVKSDELLMTIPVIFSSVATADTQRLLYALHTNSLVFKPLEFFEFIQPIQMIESYLAHSALAAA